MQYRSTHCVGPLGRPRSLVHGRIHLLRSEHGRSLQTVGGCIEARFETDPGHDGGTGSTKLGDPIAQGVHAAGITDK